MNSSLSSLRKKMTSLPSSTLFVRYILLLLLLFDLVFIEISVNFIWDLNDSRQQITHLFIIFDFGCSVLKSKPISHKEASSTRKTASILCEEDGVPYFDGEIKSWSIKQSKLVVENSFVIFIRIRGNN